MLDVGVALKSGTSSQTLTLDIELTKRLMGEGLVAYRYIYTFGLIIVTLPVVTLFI